MLKPRIIPTLLLRGLDLVKTKKFTNPVYLGDPLNTVKIFNEKKVDELLIFDIDATLKKKDPNFTLLEKIANVSRMPLAYGGGVSNINQFKKIIELGIEKVVINSAFIANKSLVNNCSKEFGSQSVVVCLDVKESGFLKKTYKICTNNGKNFLSDDFLELSIQAEKYGAGELIVNCIDKEGTYEGYDFNLIEKIRNKIDIPITVVGGASNYDDLKNLFNKFGIIGAGAGSIFVFKGKYKAVLIQYPSKEERCLIYENI